MRDVVTTVDNQDKECILLISAQHFIKCEGADAVTSLT